MVRLREPIHKNGKRFRGFDFLRNPPFAGAATMLRTVPVHAPYGLPSLLTVRHVTIKAAGSDANPTCLCGNAALRRMPPAVEGQIM